MSTQRQEADTSRSTAEKRQDYGPRFNYFNSWEEYEATQFPPVRDADGDIVYHQGPIRDAPSPLRDDTTLPAPSTRFPKEHVEIIEDHLRRQAASLARTGVERKSTWSGCGELTL